MASITALKIDFLVVRVVFFFFLSTKQNRFKKIVVANKLLLDHLRDEILLKSYVTFENKYLFLK